MAGLAALLSFGSDRATSQTLQALSGALAPRGADEAVAEHGAARLLVRSALPKIYDCYGVAMIVDGIAEVTSLAARYSSHGPAGLLNGPQPYAVVLADPDGLVLARNHDGPPLYYARSRGAVLVASEPRALIAAGIPAVANEAVVSRFLATGACDEIPATFFEGVRRVLPGQIVEVSGHTGVSGQSDGWAIRAHPPLVPRSGRPSARMALLGALCDERTGVALLGTGQADASLPTAALLAAALAERDTRRAVPVYSAAIAGSENGSTATLLGPIPDGAVRHRGLPFYTDEIDVDGFVADLGEPVPCLSGYLLWAIARASGGEVDSLLTASGWRGPSGHLSRLSDRVAARYGVTLRHPYREVDGGDESVRAELRMLVERALPHGSIRAAKQGGFEPPLSEVLQRLRPELAATLLYPRHGERDYESLAALSRLARTSDPEHARLWRHYVLERWLSTVVRPERPAAVAVTRPAETVVAGRWQRHPVATEQLGTGDRIAEKIAWYAAEFVEVAPKPIRQAFRHPWYLFLAAKSVAVAQGRAKPIWEIAPGRLARLLTRGSGQTARDTRHPDPWSMQVAIDHAGSLRMSLAALCERLNQRAWADRIIGPAASAVSPPRENACAPGHLAVTAPPREPDQVANEILGAMRRALPDEACATLSGCAIVGVDRRGVRILGWAGLDEVPTIEKMCGDNPFGQGDERTPLLIVTTAARPAGQPQSKKGGRRQPAKRR